MKSKVLHVIIIALCAMSVSSCSKDESEKRIEFAKIVESRTWKIQCKLPPKTKRFCPLVLK